MRMECFNCQIPFDTAPHVPLPDGSWSGQYGPTNWICPDATCGHDNQGDYRASWADYKALHPEAVTWPVREEIGIYAYNPAGLKRLNITR